MNDDSIQLSRVRLKIAVVWLSGTGLVSLLLILQTVFGKYQNRAQDVWSWALPTILPTLSLIMSALGADALKKERALVVGLGFSRITINLSTAYLFLVLFTILIEPFTPYEPLEWLKLSNLWLGPIQGLVASSIGVLFVSRKS